MTGNAGKHIFITGAAGGMGLATAERFAAAGWFVGLFDVDGERLARSAAAFDPGRSMHRALDVTDETDFASAMDDFAGRSDGRLDVMFNNAGIAPGAWFDEMPMATIRQIIDINVLGVIIGTRAALPLLKRTAGSISVSTSSSVATFGHAMRAVYSASKSAVKGLTEALSLEFERFGVRTADVLPGCIDTPMLRGALAAQSGGEFREALLASLPPDGPYRLMPVSAIADAVWAAYHDESGRLHWYVPEEVGEIDRMNTEEARSATRKFLFDR